MIPEAIAFDLDDTLLRDDLTISDRTVAALRRASRMGVKIIPASGRAYRSMVPHVDRIGCADCIISSNGAELWTKDGSLLFRETFDPAFAREIARFGEEYDVYMQTYDAGGFCYNRPEGWETAYARATGLAGRCVGSLVTFITEPSSKLLMMADEALIAAMLADARSRFGDAAQITCSKPTFLEFNPIRAAKGIALQRAAEHFGFCMERTAAFGDSLNDLSMLLAAGFGYAVANAREDVREAVRRVCPSSMEDGVAVTVEALLQGKEEPA